MLILKCCVRTICIVMLILQLEKYCLYEREREREKEKEKKIEKWEEQARKRLLVCPRVEYKSMFIVCACMLL